MMFNRTYRFSSSHNAAQIRENLIGQHMTIHHLDFEIQERDRMIKIIPHAENVEELKTLPITHVELQETSNGTNVKVKSHPRRIDVGGPNLIIVFCIFALLVGALLYFLRPHDSPFPPLAIASVGVLVFIIFWIRMEAGYFDYVRKIKKFVKSRA